MCRTLLHARAARQRKIHVVARGEPTPVYKRGFLFGDIRTFCRAGSHVVATEFTAGIYVAQPLHQAIESPLGARVRFECSELLSRVIVGVGFHVLHTNVV